MLNGGKNVELRVWRKGDPERDLRFTHVIFRMVERLRALKRLKHLNLRNVNILAKLGERLGPFDNAKDVIRAAEENEWKIGMDEEELIKFMTGTRKLEGGGTEEFQRSVMLYQLVETRTTSDYFVNDCTHNQPRFLPHQFIDKHSQKLTNHFQYRNLNDVAVNMDRVESTSVSSRPTMGATPEVCVPAAASAVVPAVAKPSVMGLKRGSATNGRFRLGKAPSPVLVSAPSPVLVSAPVVRDAVRIPRKRSRCEENVNE